MLMWMWMCDGGGGGGIVQFCAPTSYIVQLSPLANPVPYQCNNLSVIIVPDVNPLEISWAVFNSTNSVIMSGDYQSQSTHYCGPPGETLRTEFYDEGGDGYCCRYGGGSYYQMIIGNSLIKQGGEFTYKDIVPFVNKLQWVFNSVPFGGRWVPCRMVPA